MHNKTNRTEALVSVVANECTQVDLTSKTNQIPIACTVTQEGLPVVGARVELFACAEGGRSVRSPAPSITDAAGTCQVWAFESGWYLAKCSYPGTGETSTTLVKVKEIENDVIAFQVAAGEVHGTVRDVSGTPVAGALLELSGVNTGLSWVESWGWRPPVSSAEGTFRFERVPSGEYLVAARLPPDDLRGFQLQPGASSTVRVSSLGFSEAAEIVMTPAHGVAGAVMDSAGARVPGAFVRFRSTQGSVIRQVSCVSDASGAFFEPRLDASQIEAQATVGNLSSGWQRIQCAEREDAGRCRLVVVPSGTVRAKLADKVGNPVLGRVDLVSVADGVVYSESFATEPLGSVLLGGFSQHISPVPIGAYWASARAADGRSTPRIAVEVLRDAVVDIELEVP
jgi:hypothetical protein